MTVRQRTVKGNVTFYMTRKGWCPRTGKGQRLKGKVKVIGIISN